MKSRQTVSIFQPYFFFSLSFFPGKIPGMAWPLSYIIILSIISWATYSLKSVFLSIFFFRG